MVRRMASRRLMWPSSRLFQRGCAGVLEVGHEDLGAGVERVDDHLAIDGPGDFDAAVMKIGGNRRDGPFGLADGAGFGEEVGLFAGVEALLPFLAGLQQLLAARVERAVQVHDEVDGVGREDLRVGFADGSEEFNAGKVQCGGHGEFSVLVTWIAVQPLKANQDAQAWRQVFRRNRSSADTPRMEASSNSTI